MSLKEASVSGKICSVYHCKGLVNSLHKVRHDANMPAPRAFAELYSRVPAVVYKLR